MPVNRLVNASQAPRCQHTKLNGSRCGAPARHGRPYCCFHDSAASRNQEFVLPIIEDHASLQLALNKIMQALLDKLIDQKTASALLYGLQIALANLKQLKGEQRLDEFHRQLRVQQKQQEGEAEEAAPAEKAQAEGEGQGEPRVDIQASADPIAIDDWESAPVARSRRFPISSARPFGPRTAWRGQAPS